MKLNQLRRTTRDGRWIPEIDGLRFLAIAAVFLFHLYGELANRSGRIIPVEPRYRALFYMVGNGDRGVRLFFVISGMILALPFARHWLQDGPPVSLRKYYLRRLTRLEPPYLASILVVLLLAGIYLHGFGPGYWGHALATALYQHTLVYGFMSTVNPVTWSLEVEIQFYAIAPLMMMVYRIRSAAWRRGLLIAALPIVALAQSFIPDVPSRGTGSIVYYLQYFLTGLLLADLYLTDTRALRLPRILDAAGIASLACILWLPTGFTAHALLPVFIAILILSALRGDLVRRALATPWIATLGGMCYSIYLLHFIFIAAVFKVSRRLIFPQLDFLANLAIQLVVLGIPVLLLCTVFYILIERPCMDPAWPAKLWHWVTGRRRAEAAALDASTRR